MIRDLYTTSIAEMIANEDTIYAASLIAGAMREAEDILRKEEMKTRLAKILRD